MVFRRPELLHLHVSSRASFWRKAMFMWIARAFGIPYLLHLHGSEFAVFYEQECGPFAQARVRSAFAHARSVIVLSEAWAQWVRRNCPGSRLKIIFNPVLVPADTPAAAERPPDSLLFLGRLGPRKGCYVLLEALRAVRAEFPSVRLLMGGDGEVDKVVARAAELGLAAHVQALGWVDAEERGRWLRSAAVYVLPSFHEGLPMSILEAMAAGLPIVSTTVGGIPEAVTDGQEGLLVPPGDPEALARALCRVLSSATVREQMGLAARKRVLHEFAAAAVVPRLESLYRQSLASRTRPMTPSAS
jgi:glycosyltransferase involved in cell wall biosynthesis